MTNAALGWSNAFVTGTATGGMVGFTAANLAGPTQYPPYQSVSGVLTPTISLDAGVATEFDAIGLFGTNLTGGATIHIQLGTTAGAHDVWDSGVIPAGVAPGYRQMLVLPPSGSNVARYCAIMISDTGNPDGFIRAGLGYAGPLWTPSNNFNYGATLGFQNDSDVQVSYGGQEYPNDLPDYRTGTFSFGLLTEDEIYNEVNEIDRLLSIKQNLLFIPNPASTYLAKQAIFGRITKSDQSAHTDFGIHTKNYAIRERL
jgi:hypothetical protein